MYACMVRYTDLSLGLCISLCIYFHVYPHTCVHTQMHSHMYVLSVCMDIGTYRYRAIWGESTLVWGFFPGEARGEPGWALTPSPYLLFGGWWWVFPPAPVPVGLWWVQGGSGMGGTGRGAGAMLQSWCGSPAGPGLGVLGSVRAGASCGGSGRHSAFYPHPLPPTTSFPCNAFPSIICEGKRGGSQEGGGEGAGCRGEGLSLFP